MKKLPIFLISALTMSGVFAGFSGFEVQAMYKGEDGWPWWTVEELLEYRDEVLRDEQELCGDNPECKEELYYSKMDNGNEQDNKFQSLQMLIEQRFVVTSVNPVTGVVKVLYNDEDEWMRRMGIEEREDLNMLYMGWFEENPNQIYGLPGPIENYLSNGVAGAHLIYAWQIGSEEGYILNPGEEVEIYAASDLNENSLGRIGYVAEANFFNAAGQFDYLSCLSEPDYIPGVDCKLMLSAGHAMGYFPPRETIEEGMGGDVVIADLDNSDIIAGVGDGELDGDLNSEIEIEVETENAGMTMEKTDSLEVVRSLKVPETGVKQEGNEKAVEMPWWMIVLFAVGAGVIIWFFWPSGKKRKNRKNFGKKY